LPALRWSLLALAASPAWASYQYYLTELLASVDAAKWNTTGAVAPLMRLSALGNVSTAVDAGLGGGGSEGVRARRKRSSIEQGVY
jgi:hypothetical protein